jgi:hypothetical protein
MVRWKTGGWELELPSGMADHRTAFGGPQQFIPISALMVGRALTSDLLSVF